MGSCNQTTLQAIVDKGADVNATNNENEGALILAALKGNVGAINILLKAGADPNIADVDGNTTLHGAAFEKCSKEALQVIIDYGANVKAVNKSNKTAPNEGNQDTINVPLNAGADSNIADANYGDTCLTKVCDKTSGKVSRYSLPNIKLTDNVVCIKSLIAQKNDINTEQFNIIYCGQHLMEDQAIDSCGIKGGVTLYVFPARKQRTLEVEKKPSVSEVVNAIQSVLSHPAYRNTAERVLNNQKLMDEMITKTPGLAEDPVARGMLQEPELLAILADQNNAPRILEAHPFIGNPAIRLAAAIKKELSQSCGGGKRASRSTIALDQMSDNEDTTIHRELVRELLPRLERQSQPAVRFPITQDQFAAALAAATVQPAQQLRAQQPQPLVNRLNTQENIAQILAAAIELCAQPQRAQQSQPQASGCGSKGSSAFGAQSDIRCDVVRQPLEVAAAGQSSSGCSRSSGGGRRACRSKFSLDTISKDEEDTTGPTHQPVVKQRILQEASSSSSPSSPSSGAQSDTNYDFFCQALEAAAVGQTSSSASLPAATQEASLSGAQSDIRYDFFCQALEAAAAGQTSSSASLAPATQEASSSSGAQSDIRYDFFCQALEAAAAGQTSSSASRPASTPIAEANPQAL